MADLLLEQGWLTKDDAETMRTLGLFGDMIGNTDMHFGNMAFELSDSAPLGLIPAYDMLPMLYAPGPNGAIVARMFKPPVPLPRQYSAWVRAADAAQHFWTVVATDLAISGNFRDLATANGESIRRLQARFGAATA